jgi:hypothetical protein
MATRMSHGPTEQQRRRIRWTTLVLALTALGIYVAFIASAMMKAPHP